MNLWISRTVEIKVWKILAALAILPILVFWFNVVHQDDEILALVRNNVATDTSGKRIWAGSFVNTNDTTLRDVAVTVDFLDSKNSAIAHTVAETAELPFGKRLELQAALPPGAARLRIHSVQWRMGNRGALLGPFREPWEFGYLMVEPDTRD